MRLKLWIAVLTALGAFGQTRATIAGRSAMVWKPEGEAPRAGFPAVVFSHGFTGCATQSTFLTEAIARAGYLVVAPNHKDAVCGGQGRGLPRAEERFGDAKDWTDATYKDRLEDVKAVLDALTAGKTFEGVAVDARKIVLAGHSLGGYTVLGLAGAWPSWKDARVKAVLALSPFCTPFIGKGDLARMNVPVMYQGGTLDIGITPSVRRPHGAFERSSAPKYYVELDGAGHFAWTDLNKKYQDVIARYSVAFLDSVLRPGDNSLDSLFQKPYPKLVRETRAASAAVSVNTPSAKD